MIRFTAAAIANKQATALRMLASERGQSVAQLLRWLILREINDR